MSYMGAYPGVGACPGHYGNSEVSMTQRQRVSDNNGDMAR